jgi:hypothetical protein
MTRREFIETKFPYPISDMVIKNCTTQEIGAYLDAHVADYAKPSSMLKCLFTWSYSPEGHSFWESFHDKLEAKNL